MHNSCFKDDMRFMHFDLLARSFRFLNLELGGI
jgi:hypothetical protein